MTGAQMMVVLIVAIVMIASIIKSKHGPAGHRRRGAREVEVAADASDAIRLREEVKQLKERLAVLERITIEKESSLERQIEQLRER